MPDPTAPTPDDLIGPLSTEERARLGSGRDFWSTEAIGNIPSIALSDGPHGLRYQDPERGGDALGIGPSIPATCFPPAVGLGQSWDPELTFRVGAAIGREARAAGVHIVLGPGINIKRDPRCGRNFEYYSEDPRLTAALATGWVRGLQQQGVGASLKHFAANNTEHERMTSSSDIDPRPLREIYLHAFGHVVREAAPWTVMCSYNKINGVYAAQNHWLLTEILRTEWGFEGVVVSDWGAVDDRVAAVAAGLDLAMPGADEAGDRGVVTAVADGSLDPSVLEASARRVAALAVRATGSADPGTTWNADEHHALARAAAARCAVLLKNDNDVLPLAPRGRIAVIGEFATEPRYQGGGSSHVDATRVDIALDEIRAHAGSATVTHARGFDTGSGSAAGELRAEAVETAARADIAVLFLGLAATQESEGFDREDIELPADQVELLHAVRAVQSRVAVVLAHGGVLRLAPIVAAADAILDAALLGQAAGGAIADLLFGITAPSGRLTETVPVRLADVPAYDNFPGEQGHVRYGEGIFIGYRWYDRRELEVSFPFGHGLSYTTFDYADPRAVADPEGVSVTVRVTNSGSRTGREVVQVYTGLEQSSVLRPPRELGGFTTVELEPGAAQEVTVRIPRHEFARWHEPAGRWVVEGGEYTAYIGGSSRDLPVHTTVRIDGDVVRVPLTRESPFSEVMANPVAGPELGAKLQPLIGDQGSSAGAELGVDMARMIGSIPIGRIALQLGGLMTAAELDDLLSRANS
ncbi:glycoside hydrolase family 3 C-terminal domain-containing protein [Nocardia jinanensis]|uniref:Glycosyl hydrolase n=1 Tax=Nocardia jinanensis TaxID=382504 RepID=A0A917RAR9_9NOCA|nr:glycoside hydrolase family 3 C-terminal domain-containing protein [Nocardia jinanensis]GGK98748.1 glycosyl hydrolase [Nocardia jinanensis]